MTGWELGNCRRNGWDPIVLVFNNRSWEMLRAFQPDSAFNDLDDWHFAELADGLGGAGQRVDHPARAGRGVGARDREPRPLPADRDHAGARRDVGDARPLRRGDHGEARRGPARRLKAAAACDCRCRLASDRHEAAIGGCGTA